MDGALVKEIGTKALLLGAGGLLIFWTVNAVKLVIGARGINPLVKKFFNQIAEMENVSPKVKLEVQRRLRSDFSE